MVDAMSAEEKAQVEKLPVWAQKLFHRLSVRLDDKEDTIKLLRGEVESPFRILDLDNTANYISLPVKYGRIRIFLKNGTHLDVAEDGDRVRLNADRGLVIQPTAWNTCEIVPEVGR